MLYTGLTRSADEILPEQAANIRCDPAMRAGLSRMAGLARQMRDALNRDDLDGFGEVLHANWQEKRILASGIATPAIDAWYDTRARPRRRRRQAARRGRRRLLVARRSARTPRRYLPGALRPAPGAVPLRTARQPDHLCRGE